jgi:SAM-dependent methyltransferase
MTTSPPAPMPLVQRVAFLQELCAGRSVLHLGCTNWPYMGISSADDRFLHAALMRAAAEVWGIDADREGIEVMARDGVTNLHVGDLEKLASVAINRTFDVVVAGEVIEHLSNPGLFLRGVQRFMGPDTILVVTTVNAYCAFRALAYGLRGKRGRAEPVHPDHVAYYSYSTLRLIAERAGLTMQQFAFYDLGREHRPFTRRGIALFNDMVVSLMPHLADGVIGVFRRGSPPS